MLGFILLGFCIILLIFVETDTDAIYFVFDQEMLPYLKMMVRVCMCGCVCVCVHVLASVCLCIQ